jgi:uncharacterized protein YceH (UPF0502 family)
MLTLSPIECRVLSVLVEKAQTTPQQYPMTLNALTLGCNQKNNRDPVTTFSEDDVLESIDSLMAKGLARQVELTGSRVPKFRHIAREGLNVDTNQLVVLAELLMRGPQTVGELRGRASRMHPLESTEVVENILASLIEREEPLVRRIARSPGEKAERFAQLLCPNLHPLTPQTAAPPAARSTDEARDAASRDAATSSPALEARVAALERDVAQLKAVIASMHPT